MFADLVGLFERRAMELLDPCSGSMERSLGRKTPPIYGAQNKGSAIAQLVMPRPQHKALGLCSSGPRSYWGERRSIHQLLTS